MVAEDIEKLNAVLLKAGLLPHVEPAEADSASIATYGYSGLHYLRRCAVHLQYAGRLPPRWPTEQPTNDPFYMRYSAEFQDENANLQPGDFARSSGRRFDHVYMHSDAEGYYVPQRFDRVLIANEEAYGWVGSSYALAEECERLRRRWRASTWSTECASPCRRKRRYWVGRCMLGRIPNTAYRSTAHATFWIWSCASLPGQESGVMSQSGTYFETLTIGLILGRMGRDGSNWRIVIKR